MSNFRHISLSFMSGFVFGTEFILMFLYYQNSSSTGFWRSLPVSVEKTDKKYDKYSKYDGKSNIHYSTKSNTSRHLLANHSDFHHSAEDDNRTAEQLYRRVRVFCWIMTSPATLLSKAIHVRDTWSKRCNVRLFMSSVENKTFPAVGLPVREGRSQLYEKTKEAYKYIWKHYKDQADWFLKADDDTYLVAENLRFLLKDYDPQTPLHFGRRFKLFVKQGYMSGGAGYVLSKEALERYVHGLDTKKCPEGGAIEDVEIGKCLEIVGVEAGDSRDQKQKDTFHPVNMKFHLKPEPIPQGNFMINYDYYPSCRGIECSSIYPISFHKVTPDEMYVYEYMIYHAKVYGVAHTHPKT
uniref:glycoprotein-N-acetylgalactosamine 3-beta-galactosyltransferase 1-like isoform X1 n=1 Tax=Styela clava TaxID=7725 RepID=UPI00193A2E2A|nr:glycoprotein-N-acetylgalactosamine 3-beta-galactosyltransferase 1-like isoform X1 [Styela clava]